MAQSATAVPDFGTYLLTNLLADVNADILPDVQGLLTLVQQGGFEALLLPSGQMQLMALLPKLQADGMKAGNDLSKQIATFFSMWLPAKLAALQAKLQPAAAAPAAA